MSGPDLHLAFRIEVFASLPSTQDAMRERLERGEEVHGLVIRAAEQTRARGRRARDWSSGPGGSYQTLAVRDSGQPTLRRGAAALAVAVGLAETFPRYGVRLEIKWPNDLYFRGKKLAGILCEYRQGHLLVGVGVNVANDVPATATALRGWDVDGVHAVVLEGVQRGLELLVGGDSLSERFAPFDMLLGRHVAVEGARGDLEGLARGIDDEGCLSLASAEDDVAHICDGHVKHFGPPAQKA